ncbi:unnamed protein product [Peronospora effusa]|nr:unnamed protein product [Peronospora effusa]
MKVPESDHDDTDVKLAHEEDKAKGWQLDQLEWCFHWKALKDLLSSDPVLKILKPKLVGSLRGPILSSHSDTEPVLLECDHDRVIQAGRSLFSKLVPRTGERDPVDQTTQPIEDIPKGYHTGSSQYVSAESEGESDDSINMQRMSLGPAGAAHIRERLAPIKAREQSTSALTAEDMNVTGSGQLQSYFEAAMRKYEQDQARMIASRSAIPTKPPKVCISDVDMESAGSRQSRSNNYDPDDLGLEDIRRPQVASAGAVTNGREKDEDRARSWVNKAKSALLHDQAPDDEKCLVFGDLLTGPARNWYSQLSRSTRNYWKSLLETFMIQYCGYGMSVGRQYYHAKKRSDETPLEYLYRLNVAAIRAKIPIREGSPSIRGEHVEHFIGTLDDRDLAKQLTLLRLGDADDMKETLRTYQRMEGRQYPSAMGSSKFRQRSASASTPAPSKPTRAVRAIRLEGSSSESDSKISGSDAETDRRNLCVATVPDRVKRYSDQRAGSDHLDQDRGPDRVMNQKACTHCGSKKHDDRG